MPAQKAVDNPSGTRPNDVPAWLTNIIPNLKERWVNYFSDPASLELNTWLDLLFVAATTPWEISEKLSEFLHSPKSSLDLQNSWITLSKLFTITLEAAQANSDQLNASAWQNLLEIQSRILQQAATVSLARPDRPNTAVLSRRALYLQTITELNKKIINIWDPAELLDEVVVVIQKNLGYDYVNLFRLDQTTQTLTLQSAIWKGQRPKPGIYSELKVGNQNIVSRVAATGQIVQANDVSQKQNSLPHPALTSINSQLAIPLIVGNNLVGVLEIENDQPDAFTEDDRQIGRALADHVAVALENARLQSAVQRHLREKTLLYESNLALGASLEMETIPTL